MPLTNLVRLALVPGFPAVAAAAMLLTYRPSADGALGDFAGLTGALAGLSIVVYGLVRTRVTVVSIWPLAALVVVLVLGGGLHAVRLAHPVRHGAALARATDGFASGAINARQWEQNQSADGIVQVRDGRAFLSAPPGSVASLEFLLPSPSAWWLHGPAAWLLPRAFDGHLAAEEVTWQAGVERQGGFFVLFETRRLLVQATPSGINLTHRAAGSSVSTDVPAQDVTSSQWRVLWTPERSNNLFAPPDGRLAVWLNGRALWSAADDAPLGFVRFGETRPDQLHAGQLTLQEVRYRRWWQPVMR